MVRGDDYLNFTDEEAAEWEAPRPLPLRRRGEEPHHPWRWLRWLLVGWAAWLMLAGACNLVVQKYVADLEPPRSRAPAKRSTGSSCIGRAERGTSPSVGAAEGANRANVMTFDHGGEMVELTLAPDGQVSGNLPSDLALCRLSEPLMLYTKTTAGRSFWLEPEAVVVYEKYRNCWGLLGCWQWVRTFDGRVGWLPS